MEKHPLGKPNQPDFGLSAMCARDLASSLLLSELLITLIRAGIINLEKVHYLLWTAGARLTDVCEDLGEQRQPLDLKRLEKYAQHNLDLIEEYVDIQVRIDNIRASKAAGKQANVADQNSSGNGQSQ